MTRSLNADLARIGSVSKARPGAGGKLSKRRRKSAGSYAFAAAIAIAIAVGWMRRGFLPTAEAGTGYYLGIIGALSMLALLLYPLRKHAPFMRKVGTVAFWFRTHMALGLIGPTLILYHANFSLGAINSNVALWAMLLVAGSGIVGRVFYAKIHTGLYGAKADLRNLADEAREIRSKFGADFDPKLVARLDAMESAAFAAEPGMVKAAMKMTSVVSQARSLQREVRRRLKKLLRGGDRRDQTEFYDRYFQRIEQAAELGFYERLFAAWHLLHLPLFILLILTALVHVVAVHLY